MKNGLDIDLDGTKFYYKNGEYHREDGPAIEYTNGVKYWYLNGKRLYNIYSQEQFLQYMKLRAFW